MNSNYGKSSFSNLDFDLGLGSNRPRSLNDQKNNNSKSNPPSYNYTSSYSQQPKTTPSWQQQQPGKPSWTHQPAPSQPASTRTELGGPTSMVGDIFGKTWGSAAPASSGSTGIGIVNKNPNLFGDLVTSALGGQNKGTSNAPLKSAPPARTSFSMGGMSDSLPKTSSNSVKSGQIPGSFASASSGGIGNSVKTGINSGMNMMKNSNANSGGASMRSMGGIGVGMSSNKDPFGSLVDFGSKPMNSSSAGLNSAAKPTSTPSTDFAFGDFQNASKQTSSGSPFSSANSDPLGSNSAPKMSSSASKQNSSGSPFSSANIDPLGSNPAPKMSSFGTQNQTPAQPAGGDSFDMFFTSAPSVSGVGTATSESQVFSGGDDWGFGGDEGGSGGTTELEGLPPPPAGVSASSAKTKGLDNYKQGQYADAIKWLSWAEVLLEKGGDTAGVMEVLSCRASCYKEVGEYKKAVADCTKVLDHDGENVAVLVQRALLYESMEKYRLGADDLRTVMKLDPGNRVARSTIHRLNKMAD